MNGLPKVLVTGATGFVGSALVRCLTERAQSEVICASRSADGNGGACRHHDLLDSQQLPQLDDVHVIVHTAARVHVMVEHLQDSLGAFRAANVTGTLALAMAAAASGVRRFVYISSVKVNGEETHADHPFSALAKPAPQDEYGLSKLEAEQGLRKIELETGMEVVIIRPPLVYGPGVKANFHSMMKWLYRGIPLPLGAIDNKRSLVALDNLVDLLITCTTHPAAAGQTFMISDGEDLSTTELLTRTAFALGKKPRLISVPPVILQVLGRAAGKRKVAQRLCGSLQVDISATCRRLDWTPPVSVDQGLKLSVRAYLAEADN